jgi:hypothetical protein
VTLFFLDRRSQLAILLAASVTQVVVPACGGRPGPGGPDHDGGTDSRLVDAQADYHVSDPMPWDAQWDPTPQDAQADYHVSDPLPWDVAPGHAVLRQELRIEDIDAPPPLRAIPEERDLAAAHERAARADDLPLSRALNVRIARLGGSGDAVRLRAVPTYASPRLSFVWTASDGTLSSTSTGEVLWTPPEGSGRHLIQVVVRDGERALAVDAIVEVR